MLGRPYKKIKKDYQRKNLQNPFFRRRQPDKKPRSVIWIILLAVIGFLAMIWLVFFAPWWQIKNIKIEGLTRINSAELEKIIWDQASGKHWVFFRENNIFLFDKTIASEQIISAYNFAGLTISKKLPNTLILKVSERPYAFIFQEGGDLSYSSADAYLIKETAVKEEDKKRYFILENKSSSSMVGENNKLSIKNDYLIFIFGLSERLIKHSDLPVERFIIDQEFNTIKVKVANGPLIYFNTKESADDQIERLLLVKNQKIKDNFSKTNYMDLRYSNQVIIYPDFK